MKIKTTLNATMPEWAEISWEEFNKMLFNEFNSPEAIRIREKNDEDVIVVNFDLEFTNVHNENCCVEISIDNEYCDYRISCFTQLPCGSWEYCKDFEQDAKTPKRCIEIIKEHLCTPYAMLMEEEKV
tara:strand:- start:1739 stop:2119 length:381 start_codon:yes stop_codon:yes gene_type:complete